MIEASKPPWLALVLGLWLGGSYGRSILLPRAVSSSSSAGREGEAVDPFLLCLFTLSPAALLWTAGRLRRCCSRGLDLEDPRRAWNAILALGSIHLAWLLLTTSMCIGQSGSATWAVLLPIFVSVFCCLFDSDRTQRKGACSQTLALAGFSLCMMLYMGTYPSTVFSWHSLALSMSLAVAHTYLGLHLSRVYQFYASSTPPSSSTASCWNAYLDVSTCSFLLSLPCFLLRYLMAEERAFADILRLEYLLPAAFFNFLCQATSLLTLSHLSTVLHSLLFWLLTFGHNFPLQLDAFRFGALVLALVFCGVFIFHEMKRFQVATTPKHSKRSNQLPSSRAATGFAVFVLLAVWALLTGPTLPLNTAPSPNSPRGTHAFSTFAWPPLPPTSFLQTVQPRTSSSAVPPEQQHLRIQCIGAIRERVLSKMGPLFPPNNKVVMLDWPQYWNLGDTLIWAGEFNFLKALGMYPPLQQAVYLPDYAVRRLSPNITLFWTGGGNFGDLWRVHSDMRNKLIRLMLASSMHNPLIIGPQSIFYNRTQTAEEDARLFAKAPQITLTLRDRESWQFSEKYFRNTQRELLPDMAFMNGPLRPNREPLYDFLVLLRKDIETRFPDPLFAKEMTAVMDAHAISYRIVDWSDWEDLVEESLWKEEHPEDLTEMTLWQVELANNILSLGRRVISDRLHATLMSMLLGKEVIYLDNIYKKISNTLETAFEVHPSCSSKNMGGKRANTLKEAAEIAVEWVRAERNE